MTAHNEHHNREGTVFEIQRMSTEDGPGIRTTVFMKGCTLKCTWCHNPESISPEPQVHWIGSRCIGCKRCIEVCPVGALLFDSGGISIDRDLCTGCGICAEECPSTAMELLGKKWTVGSLIDELIRDRVYFEKSGGGITIGGGESTMQSAFVSSLLKGLKAKGIHTAIDTCGLTKKESLDMILPYTDLVLYDIKEINPDKHRAFTGSTNERILDNLIYISEYMNTHVSPKEMWIRTPIIPITTAREDNIRGIGLFIAKHLGNAVKRWELLSFNNLCKDKYLRLGLEWEFSESELLSKAYMEKLTGIARHSGVNPEIVQWSGMTKLEGDNITGKREEEVQHALKRTNTCSTV
jgi:pyruvate formate lyase activating enzyme